MLRKTQKVTKQSKSLKIHSFLQNNNRDEHFNMKHSLQLNKQQQQKPLRNKHKKRQQNKRDKCQISRNLKIFLKILLIS